MCQVPPTAIREYACGAWQTHDQKSDVDGQRPKSCPAGRWRGSAIRRQFTFGGFPDALAFVVRLGFDAEAADHHPDILVNYKRVTLTYSTHSEGGLTEKDFAGAPPGQRARGGDGRKLCADGPPAPMN